jgi:undecaprenyl pyrophosphate synthase
MTDVMWPDFRETHLRNAIEAYARRTRVGSVVSG